MIKVEANQQFTLADYDKIKDTLIRKGPEKNGTLFKGDIFECDEKMAKYLSGDNESKIKVVDLIEIKSK